MAPNCKQSRWKGSKEEKQLFQQNAMRYQNHLLENCFLKKLLT